METNVQRWGNSLGVRIPKVFADQAGVEAGSTVDISVSDGEIVLKPLKARHYRTAALIRKITGANLHDPIEADRPVGGETW